MTLDELLCAVGREGLQWDCGLRVDALTKGERKEQIPQKFPKCSFFYEDSVVTLLVVDSVA